MAKARVHEVARELGVSSTQLLTALAGMGEFVRSASSTLEAPVIRRLRDHFSGKSRSPGSLSKSTARAALGDGSIQLLSVAANYDAQRGGVRRRAKPTEKEIRLRWANRMFEPAEMRAWCSGGLQSTDEGLAAQCRDAGLSPDDLDRRVDGARVVQRLTGGESAVSVWSRLREQGTSEATR